MIFWLGCTGRMNVTDRCKSASNKQSLFYNQQRAVEKVVYSSNKTLEHQNKFGFIKVSRIIKVSFGLITSFNVLGIQFFVAFWKNLTVISCIKSDQIQKTLVWSL